MLQSVAAVTLGIEDIARSKRFYTQGFGWNPVWENEEIIFYQMNGFVLGTFLNTSLEEDMNRSASGNSAFSLAHNVTAQVEVEKVMQALIDAGGSLLRKADAPPHGGFRGYVADPDGHAWEIAHNAQWPIDAQGHVSFRL
ncbi:VOC family protein [Limoniibacter endophyticus]|uniref:VOC domain-containing protein n=1 Tax=Limoniibacter endophyticus TaxID=1565040 RepID=A0A8J3DKB7_9HYPH|nr:VOC family protein [Limoniibacter endophyticus]GHC60215.1 hypothetical protein GCM10010136_00100 [Limoniibacter endophyticus]